MEFLTYFSPLDKDKRWDLRREVADNLGFFFQSCAGDELLINFGIRILNCCPILKFALSVDSDGVITPFLTSAYFCKVRLCPMCMYRRSLMWSARFLTGLPSILYLHPTGKFLHLTLTIRNCHINDLATTLDAMNISFKRLVRNPEFSKRVLGWVRATEVTRGKDGPMQAHPHFHVLLFVPAFYFGVYYLSQKKWIQLWRQAAELDYNPSVHVQTVHTKKTDDATPYNVPAGINSDVWSAAVSGANEVLKYAVAPLDLMPRDTTEQTTLNTNNTKDPWLVTCAHSLHHRRLVSTGGLLKTLVFSEKEADDLLQTSDKAMNVIGEKTFCVPNAVQGVQRRYKSD